MNDPMIMTRLAIIGAAGRAGQRPLTKAHYKWAVRTAMEYITSTGMEMETLQLVSGGAAWSDHAAVSLFLLGQIGHLEINLPCEWDFRKKQFVDDGSRNWRTNPGGTSNYYHRKFSLTMGGGAYKSLRTLNDVLTMDGVTYHVQHGFKARNTLVAQVDHMVAFTWGVGDKPADGGTKDTWDKSDALKVHFSYGDMK